MEVINEGFKIGLDQIKNTRQVVEKFMRALGWEQGQDGPYRTAGVRGCNRASYPAEISLKG